MRQFGQSLNRGNPVVARQLLQAGPQGSELAVSEAPRERLADVQEVHHQRAILWDAQPRLERIFEQPHGENIQPALRIADLESLCHRFPIMLSSSTNATAPSPA